MANLKDIINLAKADGGKFFVVDENGDAKLVIMSVEEYQKMLLGKLRRQIMDVEKINREILNAQLKEADLTSEEPEIPHVPKARQGILKVDLREEVIDPSFDFEGPKIEIDDI